MFGYLQNNKGTQRKVKIGFSWKVLIFNFMGPVLNRDIKWASILLVVEIVIMNILGGYGSLAAYALTIVFAFNYNTIHIKELIKKGYKPVGANFADLLQQRGIEVDTFISDSEYITPQSQNKSIF